MDDDDKACWKVKARPREGRPPSSEKRTVYGIDVPGTDPVVTLWVKDETHGHVLCHTLKSYCTHVTA